MIAESAAVVHPVFDDSAPKTPVPSPWRAARHRCRRFGLPCAAAAWLRRAVPDAQGLAGYSVKDLAITAGAAIGALDAVVRGQEKWAGAWRQRLALAAAAASVQLAGRVEDEAALHDVWCLRPPGSSLAGDESTTLGPACRL